LNAYERAIRISLLSDIAKIGRNVENQLPLKEDWSVLNRGVDVQAG
jgi:hypothetical protein